MLIQKCKNCSRQFKWYSVFKSIMVGYRPVECEYCKTQHYIYFMSRMLFAISIPLPLLFQKYCYSYFGSYSIFIYLIWIVFTICIFPFLARYYIKNKDVK